MCQCANMKMCRCENKEEKTVKSFHCRLIATVGTDLQSVSFNNLRIYNPK